MTRLISVFSSLVVLGCAGDKPVSVVNDIPSATITSHVDGDSVTEGQDVTFVGAVSDNDDDASTLSATWYVDDLEVCSATTPDDDGTTSCTASLSGDSSTVRLEVRDPEAAAGVDSVDLNVIATEDPEAEITAPTEGEIFRVDDLITLAGIITDAEDDHSGLTAAWTSSVDGDLEVDTTTTTEGEISGTTNLTEAEHALTLTVTDSDGNTDSDEVIITVLGENQNPTCAITSPEDGIVGAPDALVTFVATAEDDGGNDSLTATWSSDADGVLSEESAVTSEGEATYASSELSTGTHVISLQVVDEDGASCTDDIVYTVGTAPTVVIVSPEASGAYYVDSLIEFSGTVEDGEDAPEDITVTWVTSAGDDLTDMDTTPVSSGDFSSFANLTEGEHALTVTATDTTGLTDEASVVISVGPANTAPTCALTSPSDGAEFDPSDTIAIEGTANDVDVDDSTLTVSIESDIAGVLSTPVPASDGSFSDSVTGLAEGDHEITLTVTDDLGESCEVSVDITIAAANTAPVCSIDSPADGDTFDTGVAVAFTGTATDAEDDDTTLSVEWSSSWSGFLTSSTVDAAGSTTFSIGTLAVASHTITMTVEDSEGSECTDSIDIEIGLPPTVAITSPADGSTHNDDAAVAFTGTVSDAVTSAGFLAITWTSDVDGFLGSDGADGAGNVSLDASGLSRGAHTITLDAEDADGLTGTASIGITINALPSAPVVRITPDPASTSDDLVVTFDTPSTDDDGTTPTYSYAWTVDGAPTSDTTDTVSAADTARDQVWAVTVTPSDAFGDGLTGSDDITIDNTAPVISSVTLSPGSVYTNDTITATVVSTDDDSDSVTYTYVWDVDGVEITGEGATLSGVDHFDKGDDVFVTVTPNDGTSDGAELASDFVTVLNTLPPTPTVSISPATPVESLDDLTCVVDSAGTDVDDDGDAITYSATWTLDGGAYGAASTTTWPGDTVSATATVVDQAWVCTVTPNDAEDDGDTATASVTIGIRCDWDDDGYDVDSADCGGDDCDDGDDAINPGATEIWYDGVDQDCNDESDYDADEDGYDSMDWGGEDCADSDPTRIDCSDGVADYLPGDAVPQGVAWHTVESNNSNERLLLYGGQSYYELMGELFTYDILGDAWGSLTPAGVNPGPRMGHASAMDDANDKMYIFGGQTYYTLSDELFVLDTSLSAETWTLIDPDGDGPPPLVGASMVHHPTSNYLFVFGGQTYYGLNDELWYIDLDDIDSGWSWSPGGPEGIGMAAVFDLEYERAYVFGGQGYHQLNDAAWCFDPGTPTFDALSVSGDPIPPATGMAATWSDGAGGALLYGGQTYYNLGSDAFWVRPTETCAVEVDLLSEGTDAPPPLTGAAMAWSTTAFEGFVVGGQTFYALSDGLTGLDP